MTDRYDDTRPLTDLDAGDTAPLDVDDVSGHRSDGPSGRRWDASSGFDRLRRWWQEDALRRKRVVVPSIGGAMLVLAALLFAGSSTGTDAAGSDVVASAPDEPPVSPADASTEPTEPTPTTEPTDPGPGPTAGDGDATTDQQAPAYRITDAIVGLDAHAVTLALQEAGFVVERQVRDSDQPSGTVLAVDPPVGSHVRPGDRIVLLVAS